MLRPMSTGELMDRTLVLYKKHFKLFVGIATLGPATYLLFQLLTIGSAAVPTAAPNRANPFSAASVGFGFFAGFFVMLAGMAISHGATVRAVAAVHLGLPIGIIEAYRSLRGKIFRILGVFFCMGLLAGLAVIGAVVLIAILSVALSSLRLVDSSKEGQIFAFVIGFGAVVMVGIAALVVWVRYALAIACCVVEDLGVRKSIKRSSFLSKGSRFRIFLVYIVFVLLSAMLGAALGALVGRLGLLLPSVTARLVIIYIASFVVGTLTGPLATIGIALVYYDERVRKEAFDLQLMMSSLEPPAQPATAAVPVNP
jgi:MFS family permease